MEEFCECDIYYKRFDELVTFFMKSYAQFKKIDGTKINTKKKINDTQNQYDILISLRKNIVKKGDECLIEMKKCSNYHENQMKEINVKIGKINELLERINKHFEKIKSLIPPLIEEEKEDEEQTKMDADINNILNQNKRIEEMSDKEIMENDMKTIKLVQNLLDGKEIKSKKKEEIKNIIKIKNELKDILNNIEVELNSQEEKIDNIEENVDKSLQLVEKGVDENLKKAAKDAIKRRRLKYQFGLGALFCAAGTIVPGVGNIVGAALGGLLGYGAYRLDKYRLNKIEK